MNEIMTVENVRGYLDEQGTAHLNLEDCARGLGITQVKNGVEYPRYDRISAWLKEWSFPRNVGKDSYIPENIFYRLAMKASNETAKVFQGTVADKILPSIRKTGMYKSHPSNSRRNARGHNLERLHQRFFSGRKLTQS